MTDNINYQAMLERTIAARDGTPSLLLHSCCAPCSSYVLEYLSRYFQITVFYYNPNIYPPEEFFKRRTEQERFISLMPAENPISFIGAEYESESFYETVKGLEKIPEGGERCFACYRLRLEKTAKLAAEKGFDYFTTTLSISPHKNAGKLSFLRFQEEKRLQAFNRAVKNIRHLQAELLRLCLFHERNGGKKQMQ